MSASHDGLDPLAHELPNGLTVIAGRTHLLERAIQHSTSLSADEQARFLAGLNAIAVEVRAIMVAMEASTHQRHDDRVG